MSFCLCFDWLESVSKSAHLVHETTQLSPFLLHNNVTWVPFSSLSVRQSQHESVPLSLDYVMSPAHSISLDVLIVYCLFLATDCQVANN